MVNILSAKSYVVVPTSWIFGIDDHIDKFVNESINRNQVFSCFYSDGHTNTDGQPDVGFLTDFRVERFKGAVFLNEGYYQVQLNG